jgi:hypothetical protein
MELGRGGVTEPRWRSRLVSRGRRFRWACGNLPVAKVPRCCRWAGRVQFRRGTQAGDGRRPPVWLRRSRRWASRTRRPNSSAFVGGRDDVALELQRDHIALVGSVQQRNSVETLDLHERFAAHGRPGPSRWCWPVSRRPIGDDSAWARIPSTSTGTHGSTRCSPVRKHGPTQR